MPSLKLDFVQTLALASVLLFVGYGVRKRVGFLDRFNIPAPVVGGFLFAALAMLLRRAGLLAFEFDTLLQSPLMVAFFTTIGLGASLKLLRVGGPQVLTFWILASAVAFVQSGLGVGIAKAMGVDPLLGLICGSMTMTGGHGTGAAFGKLMEDQYGFQNAVTFAMAAATFGLVAGGLLGGPLATWLIRRNKLKASDNLSSPAAELARNASLDAEIDTEPLGEAPTTYTLLKSLTLILLCMWAGGILSGFLGQYFTLPGYIGAMIVAAVARNVAELTGVLIVDTRTVDDLGSVALSLFLSMALMSLKLWELVHLAAPMFVILSVQVALMGAFAAFITYRVMGRDYDAAVMAGGHCGFGLGATPNAVANMGSIVERFGPAPRAFLVVPMVGAFFIDFSNAIILTAYINLFRA
ncbi:MAG: sodium/glutamate symporter [Vicinamibacteria bacterium]|nr:sodium/glutamate symporter [Vicinamibacteria bacterium]